MRLSHPTRCEATRNVSAFQQSWYYQPHRVPTAFWTTSFRWYMHCKLSHIKISPHFWLTFVQKSFIPSTCWSHWLGKMIQVWKRVIELRPMKRYRLTWLPQPKNVFSLIRCHSNKAIAHCDTGFSVIYCLNEVYAVQDACRFWFVFVKRVIFIKTVTLLSPKLCLISYQELRILTAPLVF